MLECSCGKQFEDVMKLRGHKITCGRKENSVPVVQKTTNQENNTQMPSYKTLPPDIIDFLEMNFGNWLNYFEVGMKWRQDFGGYGIYIKVPKQFSTEYKEESREVYDNKTRGPKLDKDGNVVRKTIYTEDIRWKPIKDMSDVKKWLLVVKEHIITNSYRKGIKLPNTNTSYEEVNQTMDDYKKSIHA